MSLTTTRPAPRNTPQRRDELDSINAMTTDKATDLIMSARHTDNFSRETVREILEELAKEKEHDPFNEDEWPDDSPAGRAPPTELTANYIRLFVECILHGDDDHRLWLKEAAECFIDGRPMPERPCPCLKEQKWTVQHLKADQIAFSNKTSKPIAALYFHPDFKDTNEVELMAGMLQNMAELKRSTKALEARNPLVEALKPFANLASVFSVQPYCDDYPNTLRLRDSATVLAHMFLTMGDLRRAKDALAKAKQ